MAEVDRSSTDVLSYVLHQEGRNMCNRTSWKRVISSISLILALAVLLPADGVATPPDETHDLPVGGAKATDAEAIAAVHGLSSGELSRAENVLENARALQESLSERYPGAFGGLYFDYNPTQRTVNWVAGSAVVPPPEVLSHPNVRLRSVSFGESDLMAAQGKVSNLLREEGVAFDSWIDVRKGVVAVDVTEDNYQRVLLLVEKRKASDNSWGAVHVSKTEALSVEGANIFAGLTTSSCTSGFVVRNTSTNVRRGTVAGHCGNSQVFNGVSSTFAGEWYSGSRDVQFHSFASNHSLIARIDLGSGATRNVTASTSISGTVIGTTVCKMGKVTGYTCGAVASKSHLPSYVPSGSATFVKVNRFSGVTSPIVQVGDSGGPWFNNSTAYGWTSGVGNGGAYGIYMSLSYLPSPWVVAHA